MRESRTRAGKDWGTGLTKVSQVGGLGTNGTAGQRETRGCVTMDPADSAIWSIYGKLFLSFLFSTPRATAPSLCVYSLLHLIVASAIVLLQGPPVNPTSFL